MIHQAASNFIFYGFAIFFLLHYTKSIIFDLKLAKRINQNSESLHQHKPQNPIIIWLQKLFGEQSTPNEKTRALKFRLNQAGFYHSSAPFLYLVLAYMAPLATGLAIYALTTDRLFTLLALFTVFALPKLILKKLQKAHQDKLRRAVPNAVDMLILYFSAGYSNDQAFLKTAEDFKNTYPELAYEFKLTTSELRLLPQRTEAWQNLCLRTSVDEINILVRIVNQNERFGSPIAKTLRTQIRSFRTNAILRAEEKAARLPTLLLMPMMLFFFPITFILFLTPAVIKASEHFHLF